MEEPWRNHWMRSQGRGVREGNQGGILAGILEEESRRGHLGDLWDASEKHLGGIWEASWRHPP